MVLASAEWRPGMLWRGLGGYEVGMCLVCVEAVGPL